MESTPLIATWLEQLLPQYGDRRKTQYEEEKDGVRSYLEKLHAELADNYTLEKPLAVGGTGVVFVGTHDRFTQRIVLKFNRPNLPSAEKSMVENETEILPQLSHPNIIRVLDLGHFDVSEQPKLTYLVEPFISGSRPLFSIGKEKEADTWLGHRIAGLRLALADGAADPGHTTEQWPSSSLSG